MIASATVAALVLVGGWTVWRHRAPQPRSIALSWVDVIGTRRRGRNRRTTARPGRPPTPTGRSRSIGRGWTYPLPGPSRRAPAADDRLFATDPHPHRTVCRTPGACGVALGGQLWGEHVYATLDGVVDRAAPGGADEHGGGYVRIAHLGGMVFTHYFHLAAIPRGVVRGARVSAGEVIGLVGDTGTGSEKPGPRPHLHFALSIRPSAEWPETFWDPTPLMATWPLRVPPHGSVAGLVAATDTMEIPRRHRGHYRLPAPAPARGARAKRGIRGIDPSERHLIRSERAAGDELAHELRAGLRDEIGEAAALRDRACLDDHDVAVQRLGVGQVVRDEHGRDGERAQAIGEEVARVAADGHVERGQRLVQQKRAGRRRARGRARPAASRRPKARRWRRRRQRQARPARRALRPRGARVRAAVARERRKRRCRARRGAGTARSAGARNRCGGARRATSMRRSRSNSAAPSSLMRPRARRSAPRIIISAVVLPAPFGPTSTSGASADALNGKLDVASAPIRAVDVDVQPGSSPASRANRHQQRERHGDQDDRQALRRLQVGFQRRVDRRAAASACGRSGCPRTSAWRRTRPARAPS